MAGRILGFVGLGICEHVVRWLHNLPPEAPDAAPPQSKPAPYWEEPGHATPPKPKPKRRAALPKVRPGLQPFCLSFAPSSPSSEQRQTTYLWALPSTSARVTSYQVCSPHFLCPGDELTLAARL